MPTTEATLHTPDPLLTCPNVQSGQLHIHAFPHGSEAWRIDWFGEVTYPDPYNRSAQPSVAVYMSRVHVESRIFANALSVGTSQQTQRRVMVSIGTLTILRIGDIWRDGRLEMRADADQREFPDVLIKPQTTTLIKAGLNLDSKGYLLPLTEYQGHINCTQSYCLMVNLPQDKRLIIPCMELIRFYFGSTSKLLASLFAPPLIRETLYLDYRFHRESRHLWIMLAQKMSAASATDIGRLILSDAAWRAAKHVGSSVLQAPVNAESIHPQSFFPFEGKSTFKVTGQWLSYAGSQESTFLVLRMISCTYPLPFNSLRYEIHGQDPTSTGKSIAENTSKSDANSDASVVEQDAARHLNSTIKMAWEGSRFADLKDKKIWKSKALTPNGPVHQRGGPSVDHNAFGEQSSSQRIRSLEVMSTSFEDALTRCEPPEFLREIIVKLDELHLKFPHVAISLLTQSAENGWTIPLKELGVNCQDWSDFDEENSALQVNHVCIFTLAQNSLQICIVFIDGEPIYMDMLTTNGLNLSGIWSLLERVPDDFHEWSLNTKELDDVVDIGFEKLTYWCDSNKFNPLQST